MRRLITFMLVIGTVTSSIAGEFFDINTIMMHWTFKIEGPSAEPGKTTLGTVFVIGDATTNLPSSFRFTLVTAAHVLENITGEKATLNLRMPIEKGGFQRVPYDIRIREATNQLWLKHPAADIAVMYVSLPSFVNQTNYPAIIASNLLADDKLLKEYEIHPGDELLCLGFPNGEAANDMGFPILRSGKIASFPLTPSKQIGSFLYDFPVFNGNSGGPVYFCQTGRPYAGDAHLGITIRFLGGLVIQQRSSVQRTVTPVEMGAHRRKYEIQEEEERLGLAVVVPAELIRESLDLLRIKEQGGPNKASEHSVAPAPQVQH